MQTKSEIKGASLVSLRTLPRSPENGALDPYCDDYRARTLTAVGAQVAKLGWIVTSDAPLGRYEVVTFASGFTASTSAICSARNANIGIFDDGKLVALSYTSRSAGWHLGVVEPLESGDLLVWGGDGPGAPIGELRHQAHQLRLTATEPTRTFCHRAAVVPNVYGKPLDAARKILIAHGWQPIRAHEVNAEWSAAADLTKHGIIEVEDCSGTGVGYCSFSYRTAAGVLKVVTTGGEPEPASNTVVNYYNVVCTEG